MKLRAGCFAALSLLFAVFSLAAGEPAIGWREDFRSLQTKRGALIPAGWDFDGKKLFVPMTDFRVAESADGAPNARRLIVEAKQSTGTLITIPGADLEKYPILRWCWRVRNLPPGGDGRVSGKDDQAAGIYFGAGPALSRKSVAYRWETEMPIGESAAIKYGAGLVHVKYFCIRNKTSPLNEWIVEERDAAADYRAEYGYIPKPGTYIVAVSGNSQYTDSHTIAEFAYIELVARDMNQ